jgi:small conductance mechanosensitive channel
VILEPIEIMGVDAFRDNAFVIKARIKTRPIQQWNVGREFNRRMKLRFDEIGIEIPLPHRIVQFRSEQAMERADEKAAAVPASATVSLSRMG